MTSEWTIKTPELERVYELWDDMCLQDGSRPDMVRGKLLGSLGTLLGASNVYWGASVRLGPPSGDRLNGFRVRHGQFLHPPKQASLAIKHEKQVEQGPDEITVRGFEGAGQHRAYLLREMVCDDWFHGAYYRDFYAASGLADAIFVATPVNADAEVCVGLYRSSALPPFTPRERDLAAFALRGLGWLHRQLLLSAGLLIAQAPLSPTERKVLGGILAGHTSKQIAAELGHSQYTTDEYVRRIYVKFGVSNRPSLLALWLGRRPAVAE